MIRYRIGWQSKLTGITGHGSDLWPYRILAEEEAERMNRELPLIYHWVEATSVPHPRATTAVETGAKDER